MNYQKQELLLLEMALIGESRLVFLVCLLLVDSAMRLINISTVTKLRKFGVGSLGPISYNPPSLSLSMASNLFLYESFGMTTQP